MHDIFISTILCVKVPGTFTDSSLLRGSAPGVAADADGASVLVKIAARMLLHFEIQKHISPLQFR